MAAAKRPKASESVPVAVVALKEVELKLGVPAGKTLTVYEIERDKLTKIAAANWSSAALEKNVGFNADLVIEIYKTELKVARGNKSVPLQRAMVLEISQYLEKYLWPNFDAEKATYEHVMSIILMLNEKFRENIPAFIGLHPRKDVFPSFFQRVLTLKEKTEMSIYEKINYLLFMINCFQSLEDEMVRPQVLQLVGLPLWHALSVPRLRRELLSQPSLQAPWQKLLKREARAAKAAGKSAVPPTQRPEVKLLPSLLDEFMEVLHTVVSEDDMEQEENHVVNGAMVLYCERFIEFLIDLLSQLPTRRFFRALVLDRAVVVKCRMAALFNHPEGRLFSQLTDLLRFYEDFEIDDHTGKQLSEEEVQAQHCERLQGLQRIFFKQVPKLRQLALANIGSVEKRSELTKQLGRLSPDELKDLVTGKLHLVDSEDLWVERTSFLIEVMLAAFEKKKSQRASLNSLPLYPNEDVMWDESLVPSIHYTGEGCLALPKLNLQFLTLHDYLLRNFNLFRLESTYEIRGDIEEGVSRMQAAVGVDGETVFRGWARMAVKLQSFEIAEVKQPHIGEVKPASVTAQVQFTVGRFPANIRSEWDELKEHDVLFLLTISAPSEPLTREAASQLPVREKYGIQYVRGCEVVEVRDEGGVLMNDMTGRIKREDWKPPVGQLRTVVVALDSAQYQLDIEAQALSGGESVYTSFNVLLRRKPKENNFKAILESIRDLMNEDAAVPPWLHDIFLGYDNPAAAQWQNMPKTEQLRSLDFKDTFLDSEHLCDSFPEYQVRFITPDGEEDEHPKPPFRVTLPEAEKNPLSVVGGCKRKSALSEPAVAEDGAVNGSEDKPVLVAEAYTPPDPGPYPQDQPNHNTVRFTPVQVDAILSGVQPGLTMVVGPPGTGKTDTAVQILHVLYHNCPGQRTLLITHSNQALNQLFEKIMQRDVPGRYLLRLGMGEQELDTEQDFSRQGRVNAMLARRLELLANVERLAGTLSLSTDVAYTCETAAHFWLLRVLSRWEKFLEECDKQADKGVTSVVKDKFPFSEYFKEAPGFVLLGQSYAQDMRVAQGCFRHLKTMFQELEECRAFELLKTTADRSNYLMTKQAKIVAMTCTHAALKRRDFLDLRFKYDSVVVEESAQILEIETFIPMLLQHPQDGRARLKRVVLIGDHHQLPPVVKNMAFQKYSHMDQSLFTRFVRLGVPYTELNAQGRARPSIACLYNWRYRALGDLPHVKSLKEYQMANAGFAFTFQFVDVPDWEGRGEMEPNPWFYQNLGEAEYVVSCFQYLRLMGYPAERIAVLTTYNGQKHLIRDVVKRRCSGHYLFGEPSKITTVDRYQGQQNDIILLSLVRTKTVGHLRDVRRLVVAMSRARLGLYVFGRRTLFEQCFELQPTFQLLLQRPDRLALVLEEESTLTTRREGDIGRYHLVSGIEEMAAIVGMRFDRWNQRQLMQNTGLAPMVIDGEHRNSNPVDKLVTIPQSAKEPISVSAKEEKPDGGPASIGTANES